MLLVPLSSAIDDNEFDTGGLAAAVEAAVAAVAAVAAAEDNDRRKRPATRA